MQIPTLSIPSSAASPSKLPITGLQARQLFLKRAIDLPLAFILVIVSSPLLVLIALLVRRSSSGPILFRQKRVGCGGNEFTMYKFRTMTVGDESAHRDYALQWIRSGETARQSNGSFKLNDDARITSIGRRLRKFSFDELPQIFNVLKGDMSLVGPRPAIPYEVDEYAPWQRQRLGTLPGITGLWQVSGRNRLSFDHMVELDIEYIRNWSIGSDLQILWKTIPAVCHGTGH
ncbi:Undecaprenyl-phosphate galactosephosphotransferase [Candidatus Koribacter versatilis Ellin345]|uniref:Undecaprenyl-phosphate galactosephosphotransferase n=1 Tax=Koribacter versatilis (strain Ellin345) TaxID=204669 RepID=Q1INF8_KORVE|nr:sugar transferase [Candidatus Koribacter versatilis]ABF41592.1 Undecaprenyl-phosphate galactosephosphotransferase [Candidatus Koribacter versatilis Ellin345]